MVLPPAFFWESLDFLRLGVSTDWFGLACPSHCHPASFSALGLFFLLGFCAGSTLAAWLILSFLRILLPTALFSSSHCSIVLQGEGISSLGSWVVGQVLCWGTYGKVRPSRPIGLANTCYIIIRAEGYTHPLLCQKASDYRAMVGNFKRSESTDKWRYRAPRHSLAGCWRSSPLWILHGCDASERWGPTCSSSWPDKI